MEDLKKRTCAFSGTIVPLGDEKTIWSLADEETFAAQRRRIEEFNSLSRSERERIMREELSLQKIGD